MKTRIKNDKRQGICLHIEFSGDQMSYKIPMEKIENIVRLKKEVDKFIDNYNPTTQVFHSFFDEFIFGKYKDTGQILNQIIDSDPSYIRWCLEQNAIDVNKKIYERFLTKMEASKG